MEIATCIVCQDKQARVCCMPDGSREAICAECVETLRAESAGQVVKCPDCETVLEDSDELCDCEVEA